jgi:hypothetical protein
MKLVFVGELVNRVPALVPGGSRGALVTVGTAPALLTVGASPGILVTFLAVGFAFC